MLRQWRHVRPATRLYSRPYSTAANPYTNFQKLRAYPFAFDQETASSLMGIWASSLCYNGLLGSTLGRFIPGFQSSVFQPKRIVPVYFPAWVYDAELEADVNFNDTEKTARFQLQNGYFPGSDFQVVSTAPLWNGDIDATATATPTVAGQSNNTLPWSSGLVHQFGSEISCIPFSVFPLTGLKALAHERTEIFPELHCNLSTIREKFAVFRPLLIPIYLAEYEAEVHEGGKRSCTVFMNAASSVGSVYAYRNPQSFRDEYDNGLDELAKSMGFQSPHNPDFFSFDKEEGFLNSTAVSISPPRDISQALMKWVEFKMRDPATIEEVAKASVIEAEDSDPRIREFDPQERAEVELWMDCGAEMMMTRRILERIQEQIPNLGPDTPTHLQAPIEHLESNAKDLEEKREELEPRWWKEYVLQKKN